MLICYQPSFRKSRIKSKMTYLRLVKSASGMFLEREAFVLEQWMALGWPLILEGTICFSSKLRPPGANCRPLRSLSSRALLHSNHSYSRSLRNARWQGCFFSQTAIPLSPTAATTRSRRRTFRMQLVLNQISLFYAWVNAITVASWINDPFVLFRNESRDKVLIAIFHIVF